MLYVNMEHIRFAFPADVPRITEGFVRLVTTLFLFSHTNAAFPALLPGLLYCFVFYCLVFLLLLFNLPLFAEEFDLSYFN